MKTLVITTGDPCGIGSEVALKAISLIKEKSPHLFHNNRFVIIGNRQAVLLTLQAVNINFEIKQITSLQEASARGVFLLLMDSEQEFLPGVASVEAARQSVKYIDKAVHFTLNKMADALVTGPVCKELIYKSGINFTGHTEYIAMLCHCKNFAMAFVSDKIRVVLATTHIPLKRVFSVLSTARLVQTIKLADDFLKNYLKIMSPKIAVCGLNPHAGEGGFIGTEEERIIKPAIELCRQSRIDAIGPVSADSAFRQALDSRYDAIIALYHDQALPVIKAITDASVNITLGLPFIRTSPDHGVAFDIAGKYIANPSSMHKAIIMALQLSSAKEQSLF